MKIAHSINKYMFINVCVYGYIMQATTYIYPCLAPITILTSCIKASQWAWILSFTCETSKPNEKLLIQLLPSQREGVFLLL